MGNLILRQNGVRGRTAPSLSTILAQGTATGLRISSADGVALLDNCPSAITDLVALYPGRLNILILDASNRVIEGWAGSVGTGEGLGGELVTAWVNDATNPYETFDGSAPPNLTRAIATTTDRMCSSDIGIHSNKLMKVVHNITLVSGSLPILRANTVASMHGAEGGTATGLSYSAGGGTAYYTGRSYLGAQQRYIGFRALSVTNFSALFSCKQVLTPSSSGITLVSTRGGSTKNVVSQATGFVHNAASYRYVVRGQRIVSNIGSWIK